MKSYYAFYKDILLACLFLPVSASCLSQEVVVKKNTNNDPRIEFKSPDSNTFVGDSAGLYNTGYSNVAFGYRSLAANTIGNYNTAVGYSALSEGSGSYNNTAIGARALEINAASENIAIGVDAMRFCEWGHGNIGIGEETLFETFGHNNVAIGIKSLHNNVGGIMNIGIGTQSIFQNSSGQNNTAIGYQSLYSNTTGNYNTAMGNKSLITNSTGNYNTAVGNEALIVNSTGFQNTAVGNNALHHNTTAPYNVATGDGALFWNTTGERNTAAGFLAAANNTTGHSNTAIGDGALYYNTTGSYNTGLGRNAYAGPGYNTTNQTCVGYNSGQVGHNSNTIEIGNTSITWIGGQVIWSTYSDARIKENINENVPGLSFINQLRPVTYNLNIRKQHDICGIADTSTWEGKYDIEKVTQSGFLAQDVEKAASATNYNFSGVTVPHGNSKLYSLQYSSFVVPLVKAVQELSAENLKLKKQNEESQIQIDALQKRFDAELASLQGAIEELRLELKRSAE